MNQHASPVLLYDGHCAFCNWAVRVVLRADRESLFSFAPLHGDFAARVMERHPHLRDVDSLLLVERGSGDGEAERVHVRSDAVVRSARLLGGAWFLAGALRVVPRPIRDCAYDLFARWRYRLFGRYESCPVPPPGLGARFLE